MTRPLCRSRLLPTIMMGVSVVPMTLKRRTIESAMVRMGIRNGYGSSIPPQGHSPSTPISPQLAPFSSLIPPPLALLFPTSSLVTSLQFISWLIFVSWEHPPVLRTLLCLPRWQKKAIRSYPCVSQGWQTGYCLGPVSRASCSAWRGMSHAVQQTTLQLTQSTNIVKKLKNVSPMIQYGPTVNPNISLVAASSWEISFLIYLLPFVFLQCLCELPVSADGRGLDSNLLLSEDIHL